MSHEFRAAALSLLIPCDVRCEKALLDWIGEQLLAMGVEEADQPSWIKSELSQWNSLHGPSRELVALIKRAIYDPQRNPVTFVFPTLGTSDSENNKKSACLKLSEKYVSLHSKLRQTMLSHEESRLVLSYSGLIITFAIDHLMSASETSRVLGARDRRLALNWYPVKAITDACGCSRKFDLTQVRESFGETTEAEPSLLADLPIAEAIRYVGFIGTSIGCQADLTAALDDLLLGARHDPYLLILHFQLSSLSNCDHAVTFAYEFSPRGQAADWLIAQYQEASLAVASNPYLNNAKALLRFDRSWAWGRSDYLVQAHALVTILEEIESLGPLPKAELARYVRALLRRVMRISWEAQQGGIAYAIPTLDDANALALFNAIGTANSGTNGILEQRMVDTVTSSRHPDWAVRGKGDSVFAASTFRKKLGDIEFLQIHGGQPQLIGYESHGGRITGSYVAGHIASFEAILKLRLEELEAAAPIDQWSLTSVFVSHSWAEGLPAQQIIQIDGVAVTLNLRYETFAELAGDDAAIAHFERDFADPLNQYHVPPSVRARAMDMLAEVI